MPIKVVLIEDDEIRKQIRQMIDGQFKALINAEVQRQVAEFAAVTMKKVLTEEKLLAIAEDKIGHWWSTRQIFNEQVENAIANKYDGYIESEMRKVKIEDVVCSIIKKRLRRSLAHE